MKYRLILSGCLLHAVMATAAVTGGTNLAVPYPDAACGARPAKPEVPGSLVQGEVDAYNRKADLYNDAAKKYVACINAYIENANNDMERIREKTRAALEPARP